MLPDTPKHIAIIMDGNRRWARKRKLPKMMGHRAGINSITEILDECLELGVRILTIYAFSTENWTRPKKETGALMGYIRAYINKETNNFKAKGIKLSCIGRIEGLPEPVRNKLKEAIEETKENSRLIFNVALNYGSRSEIVDAVRKIVNEGRRDIDEENFGDYLYTRDLADPDLLIRTSGEIRLSNFLLWQASYSELYFSPKMWPDFKKKDLAKAIEEYRKRQRRFGK